MVGYTIELTNESWGNRSAGIASTANVRTEVNRGVIIRGVIILAKSRITGGLHVVDKQLVKVSFRSLVTDLEIVWLTITDKILATEVSYPCDVHTELAIPDEESFRVAGNAISPIPTTIASVGFGYETSIQLGGLNGHLQLESKVKVPLRMRHRRNRG